MVSKSNTSIKNPSRNLTSKGFISLVFSQISQLKSTSEFNKKITSLLDILPQDISYLIEVEKQASSIQDKARLKTLENKLKAQWHKLWSENIYDKSHKPYFQKYYPALTDWERLSLTKLVKKHNHINNEI